MLFKTITDIVVATVAVRDIVVDTIDEASCGG